MPSKHRSSIIKNQDVAAATFVVGDDSEVADFLTIQEALDNLPPEGGTIFVLEGTYSISVTLTLPNKPVKIVGAGREATVISLGANAIPAFTVGFDREYAFMDFSIKGTLVVGQRTFDYGAGAGGGFFTIAERLWIEDVEKFVKADVASFPIMKARTVIHFFAGALATGLHWDGPGQLDAVGFEASGLVEGGFAGSPNITGVQCGFSLFNGGAVGIVLCSDTTFLGKVGSSALTGTSRMRLVSCQFRNTPGSPTRYIDATASSNHLVVVGCDFGVTTSEAIRTARTANGNIIGNLNCKVLETGSANSNLYSDNTGFSASTIIGADSVVNGAARKSVVGGATTDAFVDVFTHTNTKGLLGVGTVKNTDAVDSMDVRETVTDAFGVTISLTTPVAFGNSLLLSAQVNIATARPPYRSYTVAVKSTSAGNPASYNLEYVSQGEEA